MARRTVQVSGISLDFSLSNLDDVCNEIEGKLELPTPTTTTTTTTSTTLSTIKQTSTTTEVIVPELQTVTKAAKQECERGYDRTTYDIFKHGPLYRPDRQTVHAKHVLHQKQYDINMTELTNSESNKKARREPGSDAISTVANMILTFTLCLLLLEN